MLEYLNLKTEAFGLDISDLSLKIIKLKKSIHRGTRAFNLASFGESEIKPGIIKKGEIKDEERLAETIKEAIKKVKGEKLKTKYVVASLPEEKAFLQVIQMPKMTEDDLKSAVIYEAENYIPLPIEEVYLDFQIVPPLHNHLDHYDVLINALPRKTIDYYLASFKKAGLKPVALEIESSAISRASIKNEVTSSPLLLIDLGATRTGLIVFSGYALRFTSSIPISSQQFTEIISKTLGKSLTEAERLKIQYGLEKKDKIGEKVFEALAPILSDLTEQIKKCLDYYQTHAGHEHLSANGKEVQKVLLCGGGANLKRLSDFLSSKLQIPVELANPWINILTEPKKEVPEMPFEKSLSFTTALGLALRGIK